MDGSEDCGKPENEVRMLKHIDYRSFNSILVLAGWWLGRSVYLFEYRCT